MELLGLLLRVGLSLAVVLGLMWLAARALGGGAARRGQGVIDVVARQPLTRNSSVAVVRIAGKALVLGVTDNQVTVLGEADLPEPPAVEPSRRTPGNPGATTDGGPLAGSILSRKTWRSTVDALRDRTARR